MREKGANFGGEQSGHIIFGDYAKTGDGILSALQFSAAMLQTGKKASALTTLIKPYPQILKNLKEINKKKYSILKLGLFGSFSKNSDTANSDIDILVKMEFKKGMYQNFCNLHKRLEEIFQKKVDLVDESMFEYKFKNLKVQKYKDEIKEEILRSVIYV